jgi:hypothetical protein
MPKEPVPSPWYVDQSVGHAGKKLNARFRLLALHDETADVIDEFGIRRTVNRALWARDMKPSTKEPVC